MATTIKKTATFYVETQFSDEADGPYVNKALREGAIRFGDCTAAWTRGARWGDEGPATRWNGYTFTVLTETENSDVFFAAFAHFLRGLFQKETVVVTISEVASFCV